MLNNGFLLGIDPGSFKTGVAQVTPQGEVLNAEWVETKKLTEALNLLCINKGLPQAVIIGNGTNTQPVHKVLAQIFTAVPVIEIDEKHSTEQARTLYWQLNKPHGWRALLPEGLRVPPEPLDGYAAAVLVKRYLEQKKSRDYRPAFFAGILPSGSE